MGVLRQSRVLRLTNPPVALTCPSAQTVGVAGNGGVKSRHMNRAMVWVVKGGHGGADKAWIIARVCGNAKGEWCWCGNGSQGGAGNNAGCQWLQVGT